MRAKATTTGTKGGNGDVPGGGGVGDISDVRTTRESARRPKVRMTDSCADDVGTL